MVGVDFNLAMLAGLAGLGGSTAAVLGAAFFFRGVFMRVIAQVVLTTALSFAGFIAVFHALGFQIVPPKEIAGFEIPGAGKLSVASEPPPAAPGEENGKCRRMRIF